MKVYAVVTAAGVIKRSRRSNHLMVYLSPSSAKTQANGDGDSVVETEVDLTQEPLFIRKRVIDGEA